MGAYLEKYIKHVIMFDPNKTAYQHMFQSGVSFLSHHSFFTFKVLFYHNHKQANSGESQFFGTVRISWSFLNLGKIFVKTTAVIFLLRYFSVTDIMIVLNFHQNSSKDAIRKSRFLTKFQNGHGIPWYLLLIESQIRTEIPNSHSILNIKIPNSDKNDKL